MTRYAKKVDGNQQPIVDALRKSGVTVIITNWGNDFPDLLCGKRGRWVLQEVKEPSGSLDRGQLLFMVNAGGCPIEVVTTPGEALAVMEYPKTFAHYLANQARVAVWLAKNPQQSLSVKKFRKVIGA